MRGNKRRNDNIEHIFPMGSRRMKRVSTSHKMMFSRMNPDFVFFDGDKVRIIGTKSNRSMSNQRLTDRKNRLEKNRKILERMGLEKSDNTNESHYSFL